MPDPRNHPRIQAGLLIDRLERMPQALRAMSAMVHHADASWKPDERSWSLLEIVCHLVDEETDDFRARLRSTLETPGRDWDPIDPEGWAVQRGYSGHDLSERLDRFKAERGVSVAWLRSLRDPDWTTERVHPRFGSMHAGDLLGAWVAHDALHLRQISRRLHQLACRDAGPFGVEYAGSW